MRMPTEKWKYNWGTKCKLNFPCQLGILAVPEYLKLNKWSYERQDCVLNNVNSSHYKEKLGLMYTERKWANILNVWTNLHTQKSLMSVLTVCTTPPMHQLTLPWVNEDLTMLLLFLLLLLLLLLLFYSPFLGLCRFFSFLILHRVGRTPWTVDQPSQGLYLQTGQHKHRINAHNTDIQALSGIQTHDPSVRAREDRDRHLTMLGT
jgi:hypothetical protein